MTESWKVTSEEYYRNDKEVQMHQFRQDMMTSEVTWLISQVPDLPTKNLLMLHDAILESMGETKDPAVRSLLERILQETKKEIEHREQTEGGQDSPTWMFA